MDSIRRKLGYENCLEVECRGLSGGLALLWDRDVHLDVCSFSTNYIDAIVTTDGGQWRFTGLYGFPEANRKRATFHLLEHLRQNISVSQASAPSSLPRYPWCVMGDFNCIV